MNIQNRLRKLEGKMEIGEGFCRCEGVQKYELLKADLSIESNSAEPVMDSPPVPETCARCRKSIEKKQFILQLCDQTTKDRFPEHWNQDN